MSGTLWADMEFRPRFKKKQKPRKFSGYNINMPDPASKPLYIGMVWIGTTNNTMPSNTGKCKATFINQADSGDALLNLSFEECDVIVKVTTDYAFLEGLLFSIKCYSIVREHF